MDNAQYVVTGWVLTGVVLVGYALEVTRRLRRAQRTTSDPR